MTRILISLSVFFMFTSGLQAQIFGGWFRGYNNNYYNRNYYQQPRQYQQPQQQQTTQQQTAGPQYKENTWYRFADGSYRYYKNGQLLTQQQVQQQSNQQSNKQTVQEQPQRQQSAQQPDKSIDAYVFNPAKVALSYDEKRIVGEVNILRERLGLPMLVVSPSLMNTSRAQTSQMTRYGMQHWLVVQVMENIASGVRSGLQAFYMWFGSPGHYANMTSRSARFIGVGCFNGYATQQFTSSDRTPYQLVSEEDIKIQEEKIKAEEEAKAKAEEEAKAKAEEEAPVVEEETSATEEAPAVEEEAPVVEEETPATEEELPILTFEDNGETETHESTVPGFKVVCNDGVCELVPVDEEENADSTDGNNSESTEANDADNQE